MTRRNIPKTLCCGLATIPFLGFAFRKPETERTFSVKHTALDTNDVCLVDLRHPDPKIRDKVLIGITEIVNHNINKIFKAAEKQGVSVQGLTVSYRNIPDKVTNPDWNNGFFRVLSKGIDARALPLNKEWQHIDKNLSYSVTIPATA